jgi:hypothetical protein
MGILDFLFGKKRSTHAPQEHSSHTASDTNRPHSLPPFSGDGESVNVKILDPSRPGIQVERWLIGKDVSADIAAKAFDVGSQGLLALRTYEGGKPKTFLCSKSRWDEAKSEFDLIEQEAARHSISDTFRKNAGESKAAPAERKVEESDATFGPSLGPLAIVADPMLSPSYLGTFMVRPLDLADWLPAVDPKKALLDAKEKGIVELREWLNNVNGTSQTPSRVSKKHFQMLDGLIDEILSNMAFVVVCPSCNRAYAEIETQQSPPLPESSRRSFVDFKEEWRCPQGHAVFRREGEMHISWAR